MLINLLNTSKGGFERFHNHSKTVHVSGSIKQILLVFLLLIILFTLKRVFLRNLKGI